MIEALYSTEDLSKMFRVGQSTIKRWTEEGKLKCIKTPGGHRKFRAIHVHEFILQYNYEAITPLLPFARTPETITTNGVMVAEGTPVIECFTAAVRGRRQKIEQCFEALFTQGKPLPVIFDTLLTPVLRLIHAKHRTRQITPVEFQIAKSTLTNTLIHVADQIPKSLRKNLELYCLTVSEGMNEVELKAVELLLDTMGITVYNLDNALTKLSARDIVNQCKPEDVFVVLSLDQSSDEIIHGFDSLVSGVRLYGGNVFTSNFFEEEKSGTKETQSIQFHSFSEIVEQFSLTNQVA